MSWCEEEELVLLLFFTLADWCYTWGLLQCFTDSLKKRLPKNIDLRDNVQLAGHYHKINTDWVIQQHNAGFILG